MLGRSGSGKSTLLHLLGALDRPDAGRIVVAGEELTGRPPRALARLRLRHVGFVFQSFHLIEELTGEENVLLPARLPGAKRGGERRARRLIEELGLAEIADRRPHELSGGEQQRFAIARALVGDPELVLADEPTGNLDRENGAAVLTLLRGLTDRAVVIVTHEPEAAAIADRVLHLRDGRAPRHAARAVAGPPRDCMMSALAEARLALRLRRRRAVLTGLGIGLAAAMLAASLVVGDGLGGRLRPRCNIGPSRRRDRPVRSPAGGPGELSGSRSCPTSRRSRCDKRSPAWSSTRSGQDAGNGVAEVVGAGPRGYAIVGGRDVSGRPGEVVVDRGFAAAWGLRLGGTIAVSGLPPQRIVGFAEEPDNVAYPLASPQIYLSQAALGAGPDPQVNEAQIWLRDPRYLDEVLVQARAISYGLRGLRFVTRSGVRVLLDQAAGIVIDLLVALSVIALATAGVMLAASARAEVQRRLGAIGIKRAVGASRARLALVQALEALLVALPAATLGTVAGALATTGPSDRLLDDAQRAAGRGGVDRTAGGGLGSRDRDPRAGGGVAGVAGVRAAAGGAAPRRRAALGGGRPGAPAAGRGRD